MTTDPRARGVSSDEIDRAQEMARRGAAAQSAVNEMGFGTIRPAAPSGVTEQVLGAIDRELATVYLAQRCFSPEDKEILGARMTRESAQELCQQRAQAETEPLQDWGQLGSGTWQAGVVDAFLTYYEVLSLVVYQ